MRKAKDTRDRRVKMVVSMIRSRPSALIILADVEQKPKQVDDTMGRSLSR